jgi:hypothetical protein
VVSPCCGFLGFLSFIFCFGISFLFLSGQDFMLRKKCFLISSYSLELSGRLGLAHSFSSISVGIKFGTGIGAHKCSNSSMLYSLSRNVIE